MSSRQARKDALKANTKPPKVREESVQAKRHGLKVKHESRSLKKNSPKRYIRGGALARDSSPRHLVEHGQSREDDGTAATGEEDQQAFIDMPSDYDQETEQQSASAQVPTTSDETPE
jgi:hypothetical protein